MGENHWNGVFVRSDCGSNHVFLVSVPGGMNKVLFCIFLDDQLCFGLLGRFMGRTKTCFNIEAFRVNCQESECLRCLESETLMYAGMN